MQPPKNADQETLNKWHTLAIQDCDRRIINLENASKERLADGSGTAQKGHWYTSIGIWLAIILTGIVIYLCYLMYRSYLGYHIIVPEFMR
jgi:hypothetical protein